MGRIKGQNDTPVFFIGSVAKNTIFAATFLAAGAAVYLFFRSGDYLALRWLGLCRREQSQVLADAANAVVGAGNFAAFFAYNLPDGLWLLSGLMFIRLLWRSAPGMGRIYQAVFCAAALGLEFAQIAPQIPGTFDRADVITMVSAAFIEGCLYKYFFKEDTVCVSK
jgi:hypothetical protein